MSAVFNDRDSGSILRCHGMDKDNLSNLIDLPVNANEHPRKSSPWFGTSSHYTSHSGYSNSVGKAIIRIGSKGSCIKQKAQLLSLQKTLRRTLNRGEVIMPKSGATETQWNQLLRGY